MRLKGKLRVLGKWKEFSSRVTENQIIAALRQTFSSFLHPDLGVPVTMEYSSSQRLSPDFNNLPTNEQSQNPLLGPPGSKQHI